MRIVISDYSGHPFQVELSRALARRGHEVLHLHFAEFQTPKGKLRRLPDDPPGFAVEGLSLSCRFDKRAFLRRRIWEARVGALAASRALAFRADVVVGCNMPLDAQRKLQRACGTGRVAFVFWQQDVYSEAIYHYLAERFGFLGEVIGRRYQRLEGSLLRRSDAVVAISEKFRGPLEAWGIPRDRVRIIPNWAPLSEIYPVRKDNEWARAQELDRKLVALYTGTLGLKHDPALLLRLAQAGAAQGLEVVVVSEGAAAEWLARQKRAQRVANLTLLPFQPMERYPEVLGAGDVLLAMVGREAAGFSVPSKILSYLAAGKPVVASIAANNDAAATIKAARAGIAVEPDDDAAFCEGVLRLTTDPEQRRRFGRNARLFAESCFDIAAKATQFEETFAEILRPGTQYAQVAELRPA
jgi:colanic acid biosynthesis glycosyl transferase WcaI